ncbi:MAG: hypothetical protein JXQ93_10625 [Flavobacteriaceae bacterium]
MKRILLILVLLTTTMAYSQRGSFEEEVRKISKRIDRITNQQKDSLKDKVKEINRLLDKGAITKEVAEKQKKAAAEYHAKNIERLVSIQETKLQQLVQDKINGKIFYDDDYYEENIFTIGKNTFKLRISNDTRRDFENRWRNRRERRWNRRTTTQFIFAMGANNVLQNNKISSLDNSPYMFWKSRFYEVGITAKYRLTRRASKTYLKYGISFLWNNLRAENNQYHVVNGNITELQTFNESLSESRLRHVQMIFPMHLEFDFSKDREYDDGRIRDRRNQSFRIGIGGFAGFKLGTRQYLEYTNSAGTRIEELQKGTFNTNILNYGISTYFAYRSTGLYMKYDLNPFFKNTETRNFSIGVRFDLD